MATNNDNDVVDGKPKQSNMRFAYKTVWTSCDEDDDDDLPMTDAEMNDLLMSDAEIEPSHVDNIATTTNSTIKMKVRFVKFIKIAK